MEDRKLGVSQRARGVLPTKLSELENDPGYITSDELEKIVLANQVGEYTGLKDSEVEVIVDNLYKTISVKLLRKFEDGLKKILPKEGEAYKKGSYVLKAYVSGNEPLFAFTEDGYLISMNYYYGNVSEDPDNITPEILKTLSNGGLDKGDREYKYSTYKQRQVFAYPSQFGKLSKIEHVQTGFNVTELFSLVELEIEGVDYYVYISGSPSTGEYTYKFMY